MVKLILLALVLGCAFSAAPSTTGFYNAKKTFYLEFTYEFVLSFKSLVQVPFNTTTVDLGEMNLSVQTLGWHATGPYNCTLNYMYESTNDKFHYKTGECDKEIAHTYTDMAIKDMSYDSKKDSFTIDFAAKGPTSGSFEFTKSDTSIIDHNEPKDKAPQELCPPKSFLAMFD